MKYVYSDSFSNLNNLTVPSPNRYNFNFADSYKTVVDPCFLETKQILFQLKIGALNLVQAHITFYSNACL